MDLTSSLAAVFGVWAVAVSIGWLRVLSQRDGARMLLKDAEERKRAAESFLGLVRAASVIPREEPDAAGVVGAGYLIVINSVDLDRVLKAQNIGIRLRNGSVVGVRALAVEAKDATQS